MENKRNKYKSSAFTVATVGLMAAVLECGKLVLSFLPNIEVVTIFTAIFGYCFGVSGIIATVVFVCIEPLIWGFGSWLPTYFIYWPLVALVFMMFKKIGVKNRWIFVATAVGLTVFFGILSSTIETAIYLGINKFYFVNLWLYYVRGLPFYVAQISCNLVLFATLFPYLSRKLEMIKVNHLT